MMPEAAIAFACRSAIAVSCGSVLTVDRPCPCRYREILLHEPVPRADLIAMLVDPNFPLGEFGAGTVQACRTLLNGRAWQSSPPATFQHWESPQLCRLQLLHPRKLRWNRLDPRIRQTIKSHLAYVNLTDAFSNKDFINPKGLLRRALRGDMRGCYGRLPKKLAEGGEPPLSSDFLGAQADFCPGRAYRMASSQACVLLIASRHLDTGSSLSGLVSASQRRHTASQASERSEMSSGRLIPISRRTCSR